MLDAYNKSLSRLLLVFSDLADTDDEIADCLILMRVAPPPNKGCWNAANVRELIPAAFATASSNSPYAANQPTQSTIAYCHAVYQAVKNRKDAK